MHRFADVVESGNERVLIPGMDTMIIQQDVSDHDMRSSYTYAAMPQHVGERFKTVRARYIRGNTLPPSQPQASTASSCARSPSGKVRSNLRRASAAFADRANSVARV